MVRAFAVCAVILAACTASAQTVTPRIIPQPEPDKKLGIAKPEPTPVSACGEHDCLASSVESSSAKPIDNHALLKQKLAEMNCLQSEINALRRATGTPDQIILKVKMIEVSRTKMQKLGMDFALLRSQFEAALQQANAPTEFSGFNAIKDGEALFGMVEQLQQNNVAKVLSEPNMVIVCGRPASFRVGGEFPLPTAPGSEDAVEFKTFGTEVNVLAAAIGDDRVRLDLSAKFSEMDSNHEIEVNGMRVPRVSVRQINSPIELRFGQTGVLSGFIETRIEHVKYADGKVGMTPNRIELVCLITPQTVESTLFQKTGAPYHTATSTSEARPGERSLRVTTPRPTR